MIGQPIANVLMWDDANIGNQLTSTNPSLSKLSKLFWGSQDARVPIAVLDRLGSSSQLPGACPHQAAHGWSTSGCAQGGDCGREVGVLQTGDINGWK